MFLFILQTKAVIDKLQKLVSSEGRFKNLREALKKYVQSAMQSVPYLTVTKLLFRLIPLTNILLYNFPTSCDPPCVPYLGMYLADLAFIEEGTPNYTEDNLVNFSKMRMVSTWNKMHNGFFIIKS